MNPKKIGTKYFYCILTLILIMSVFLFSSCSDININFERKEETEFVDSVSKENQLSSSEIKSKLNSSVVKLYKYDLQGTKLAQGTGFYYNNVGGIATNAHVVKDAYILKTAGNIEIKNIIDYEYNKSDYCLCDSDLLSSRKVTFAETYKMGDLVYSVGYPKDSTTLVVKEGHILYETVDKSKTYIVSDAETDEGSSGGILVNAAGEVLGITTGQMNDGNYGSIKYEDFKNSMKKRTSQPLIKYFHTVNTVYLNSSNFDKYFLILDWPNGTSSDHTAVHFIVTVEMFDYYWEHHYSDTNLLVQIEITTSFTGVPLKSNYQKYTKDVTTTSSLTLYEFQNYVGEVHMSNYLTNYDLKNYGYTYISKLKIKSAMGTFEYVTG